jgi:uncharacterized membrane protein
MRAVFSWSDMAPDATDVALLVPLLLSGAAAVALGVAEWRGSRPPVVRPLLWLAPLLLLGAFLRLAWIDTRAPWEDEGLTAIRASGFRATQVATVVRQGTWLSDLKPFGRPVPGSLGRFLMRPSRHNPDVHPPLYFVLTRLWLELWGGAGALAIRRLSSVVGVLGIVGAAWLALEASGRRRAALLAAAILAVSPLQVVYSQEARMYSLLALLTLASSAMLLRFLRLGEPRQARLYAALVGLGSLTHGLFAVVAIGHALSLGVLRRRIVPSRARHAFFACAAGLACGVPWTLIGYIRERQGRMHWLLTQPELSVWARRFVTSLAMNVGAFVPEGVVFALLAIALLAVLAEIGRRQAVHGAVLAVPAVLGIVVLALVDWKNGSMLGLQPRYLVAPGCLCLVLAALAVDAAVTRWRGAGVLAAAAALLLLAWGSLSVSRSPQLWFKDSGLTPRLAAAWSAASPAHLFIPPGWDASADLVALSEVSAMPVWVQGGQPSGPDAFVWARRNAREHLSPTLDGELVPVSGRIYRFEPGARRDEEDR